MADERISTIVKEIKYWKEHKLLPEVHCDFLLALYTQGEDESVDTPVKSRYNFLFYLQLILLVLMVPFSFLVVYFTQFNSILQLSIQVLFIGYAIWVVHYLRKRNHPYVHIPIIVTLALVLILTDFTSNQLRLNQYLNVFAFMLNFIGWYLLSRKFRYRYLMISSILALAILLFLNFSHLFPFN
ncbi:hypothetical protein [Ornithinibacillus scapharcae]|uniref:hypothetical protein n=1 Tax=Ornithinibacillus scapharcae TaxID=1147159 RepID=UPI000225B398|nr:hypothetical protein [Ornithinibacillus scapharcae]